MELETDLIEKKLDELISLLEKTNIDSKKASYYEQRIISSLKKSHKRNAAIEPFLSLGNEENISRQELLDGMSKLLSEHKIDSNISKQYLRQQLLQKIVLCSIAIVLIILGFAMIVMPAPPYFEMFTIFYFNPDDGVTLMDLISLLIILSGFFLFITSYNKKTDPRDSG